MNAWALPAAAAGSADRGRRVGVPQALAAEVAVEGAQAGGLAMDRGGRRRRAAVPLGVALGELREEVADVDGGRHRRVQRRHARQRQRELVRRAEPLLRGLGERAHHERVEQPLELARDIGVIVALEQRRRQQANLLDEVGR